MTRGYEILRYTQDDRGNGIAAPSDSAGLIGMARNENRIKTLIISLCERERREKGDGFPLTRE
jgi:hypothetical protein